MLSQPSAQKFTKHGLIINEENRCLIQSHRGARPLSSHSRSLRRDFAFSFWRPRLSGGSPLENQYVTLMFFSGSHRYHCQYGQPLIPCIMNTMSDQRVSRRRTSIDHVAKASSKRLRNSFKE